MARQADTASAADIRNEKTGFRTVAQLFAIPLCVLLLFGCARESGHDTSTESEIYVPPALQVDIAPQPLPDALAPIVGKTPRELLLDHLTPPENTTGLLIRGAPVHPEALLPLYQGGDAGLLWTNRDAIYQFLVALENIADDGLDAADYHYPLLLKLTAQLETMEKPPTGLLADLDLLLSDGLIRLADHLQRGKIDPFSLDNDWKLDRPQLPQKLGTERMTAAIAAADITGLIDDLRPQSDLYQRLRRALADYRSIAARGGWPQVPAGPALKPGMTDARIVPLRQRLAATADLDDASGDNPLFDEELEQAVKHFQARNSLPDDGIVGAKTLAALNEPVSERIRSLQVNLERARWMLQTFPERFVLVDLAGFRVQYLVGGHPVFSSRVQIGRIGRKTPLFKGDISYLVLNPTWTVPRSIFRKDLLPEIKANPDYLAEKKLRILTPGSKEEIPADSIDWTKYPQKRFPYILRQDPGPQNAMGRIKFMLPNSRAIYLHDTPSKSLFDAETRAFSSGCIRVEHPFELAERILESEEWDQAALQSVIESGEQKEVILPKPIPVLFAYWTADVADDGSVIFKKDIYDKDKKVLNSLTSRFRIPPQT
ncbi:MAG: murein L,D-transpeptidase [Desulfuromonas sp.]|nr:MAG: murein L,D-transpeptidase [Desulfuromonas sp.]